MSSKRLVGIDLGGTAIKAGAVSAAGERLQSIEVPSHVEQGAEAVCERIAHCARELGVEDSLGIGVPGLVDRERNLVTHSPNLAPMAGYPLSEELAKRLDMDPSHIKLENDANVAALGEHWLGGARDEQHVLVVTLGTGVGGGLILNGELFVGEGGLAAEIGHTTIDPGGPLCGCGHHGCMEALASATATMRRAAERGLTTDLKALSASARKAAGPQRDLIHEVGRNIGHGLAQALTLLDVRCFLIGGGFGAAHDVLEPGILDGLLERSYGREAHQLRVLAATLGAEAGWIGAARLASS